MNHRVGVSGIQRHQSACLIYDQDPDWQDSLVEYLRKGLSQHQKCLCLLDCHTSTELFTSLTLAGVNVQEQTACGALSIINMADLPDDIFDCYSTVADYLNNQIVRALSYGFTGLRLAYEIGGCCLEHLGVEEILKWEAQIKQDLLFSQPVLIMAQYNKHHLPSQVLMNALHTHELLVKDGYIIPNEFVLTTHTILDSDHQQAMVDQLIQKVESDYYEDTNLRENERNLRAVEKSVLDTMINAMIMVDEKGCIMVWNKAAEQIFGYRAGEVLGHPLHGLIVPLQYMEPCHIGLSTFAQTGEGNLVGHPIELIARRKDNTQFPAELSVSPIKIRGSWYATGIVRDITERKRMEQALKDSEEMFRTLVASMDDIVFTLDLDEHLTGTYGHWVERAGIDLGVYMGKNLQEILGPSYPFHHQASILAQTGESMMYEWDTRVHNQLRYFQTSLSPLKDSNGNIKGIVGVGRDITEQKLLEKTLQEQLHFLQQMIDTIPTPAFFRDTDGVFQGCNKAFEQAVGQPRSKIVGKYLDKVLPKDLADKYRAMDIEMMNASSIQCYEWEFQYADGTRHVVIFNKAPFYNIEGVLLGVVGVTVDLTDRKSMEQEVLRLDRLRVVGEMAAGIAHEIRNPMTTVRGFLQMMMVKPDLKPYREYFDVMIEELDSANAIIGEFLSLAKDKSVDLQVQSLNNILEAVGPLLNAEALKADKSVMLLPGAIPNLMFDPQQIRQLILNIARNGLESMSPGGMLTILTYTQDDDVVLAIRDQGHGIDPQILPQLGTPFLTTKDQGTGLGLAVCYSIATRHNATVNVETSNIGTSFYIRFKYHNGLQEAV